MSVSVKGGDKIGPYLTNLVARANRGGTLRVGFLPGDVYPNGVSVASVAISNNFGDLARNIPARPFFSNLARSQRAAWAKRLKKLISENNMNVYDALEDLGVQIVGEVQDSIMTFVGVPLSPVTIRRKGHDKQLIETARLLESVAFSIGAGEEE
jgi:hypothetical protein